VHIFCTKTLHKSAAFTKMTQSSRTNFATEQMLVLIKQALQQVSVFCDVIVMLADFVYILDSGC